MRLLPNKEQKVQGLTLNPSPVGEGSNTQPSLFEVPELTESSKVLNKELKPMW
jgi:hypothetical protein